MSHRPTRRRIAFVTSALAVTGCIAAASIGTPTASATAASATTSWGWNWWKPRPPKPQHLREVQVLSFNDFHGHLEADSTAKLTAAQDPSQTPVGGAQNLATKLHELRGKVGADKSITATAGDLIGASPFLSGMFHDEPAIESLNALGLDVSSVGNHEFDEGTAELKRIIDGGCHPVDGCYFPDQPYAGADFKYLGANVIRKDNGQPFLPPVSIQRRNGVLVGFIGMTLEATPTLVNPAGVASVEFKDEVETANRWARRLTGAGVKSIVLLVHEGGIQPGSMNGCDGISGPINEIATQVHPAIDLLITGHTHMPYVCTINDPAGQPRKVTSASQYGRVVTETNLKIDRRTGDVVRDQVTAVNHLVPQSLTDDPAQTAVINKWKAVAGARQSEIVGSVATDILGSASTNRAGETPLVDLVADAILWGTKDPAAGGAQIAFMNVGGVRADLKFAPSGAEQPGQITYGEAYAVAPFGNMLVSMDLTGAQIRTILEQQYQPVPARGSRPMLALGVSAGFSYTWDASKPQGSRVVPGSMTLNGQPISDTATYRVSTLNFLADGGDLFTGFKAGTNVKGGPDDLANLVAFFRANPNLQPPADRVAGL